MNLTFETKDILINNIGKRILLQNENGPCAMVALANILLVAPNYTLFAKDLIGLVQRNDLVSLQDLVQVLANVGIQNSNSASIDVSQLLQLLPQLHTGLNINPKFNGSFEDGTELSLFRLYNIGIVHGWIVDPEVDPIAYQHVSKYSYEQAQNILVQSYDITNNGLQVKESQSILEDALYIKSFLARSATQLTNYGLRHLKDILMENSYAILFRNDHFITIFKNNGELFTLVTDLGYKNKQNIVWQSLKSVNGSQDMFYTGNFISIDDEIDPSVAERGTVANPFSDPNDQYAQATNIQQSNQQVVNQQAKPYETDEDLAKRLQEEEDSRFAGSMQRNYQNAHDNWASQQRSKGKNKADTANNSTKKEIKGKKRDKLKKSCILM